MGILGRLLGRSRRTEAAVQRCSDCGMTDGEHTDWCPQVREQQEEEEVDREGAPGGPTGGPGDRA